ncbi:lipid IV(A) 3-deoxy-D-manno-octulosonic acid transferase [uncultured Ferrimonas sp.]|uniref:lipid IV(A) 3-deoxy-D-manno-octulosonic acid transferase n=1 Tax=uncultured Ferrimonas sp. TaxID=432640 RepID=UPI00262023CC|nr:lipid IV(A) 3-deoxy-D-manno-octulosonic acid transferase [uncultured Ferrimonas sp.]
MNRFSYSLLLLLLTPAVMLYLGYRAIKSSAYRGRLGERLGMGLPQLSAPIVVHCASMGETLAALPLIRALQRRYPTTPLLVTTTTPTGSQQVKQQLGDSVHHCYLPLDLNGVMRRFVAHLNPKAVVLLETELWPNLVHHCHQQQVPVIVANARLSARSAKGYARFARVITPMLQQLNAVAVQHSADGERLMHLGVPAKALTECGSLKFDIQIGASERQQAQQFGGQLWGQRPSWIAASTHPGEFEQAIAAHQQLLASYPELLLLLVPRHPEQFEQAKQLAQQAGLTVQQRSSGDRVKPSTQVLIGDTMGEMKTLYGATDIAFVGGSLIQRGGHNPLEPAAFGKPVLMGPHYFNFQPIGDALKQKSALIEVNDQHALARQLQRLLDNRQRRDAIGSAALAFVEHNSGATERQLNVISAAIPR